jgi:magnesium-transporting ATPase (P-type)
VKMTAGDEPKMGSTVVRGEVEATVISTGRNTFFGKTADLLNVHKGMNHLQRMLLHIIIILTVVSVLLCFTCYLYIQLRRAARRGPSARRRPCTRVVTLLCRLRRNASVGQSLHRDAS